MSGGDGIATFDVADGSLEEYDSQQMFSKKKRPVPKIPPELPGSQMSFLDGLDLGCGPLGTCVSLAVQWPPRKRFRI